MDLQKPRRKRGVILTPQGLKKLQEARRYLELQINSGDRYTLEELSEQTSLAPVTVAKVLDCEEGVDKQTLAFFFRAFNLELDKRDYANQSNYEQGEGTLTFTHQDLREAVDVSIFYGRIEELAQLERWVLSDRCRLIALVGMGGIGKTALSIRCIEQIGHNFEYVIWKSLRNAPPVEDILADLIQFLSNQQDIDLPKNIDNRISRLLEYLRSSRCLLILDNTETILQSGARAGYYRQGYEGYGELLKRIGEASHQSCLLLTSREKPREIALLEGENLPIRSLQLKGLNEVEGQEIFRAKGSFSGSDEEWRHLIEHYTGNPLALKIVAAGIQEIFNGSVFECLKFLKQGTFIFDDIRDLLERQFERLSKLEKEVIYWLAINREPVSLSELQEDILPPILQRDLLEALVSLQRRSLIEKIVVRFTLQPVVMEYVTNQLIEQACEEIFTQKIVFIKSYALLKAQAKEYVKDAQIRLILKPIIGVLLAVFRNKTSLENQLTQILDMRRGLQQAWSTQSPPEPEYTGGNVLNLLCCLQADMSSQNFSALAVWQADLRYVNLHKANFAYADLDKSIFAEACGSILSVAFSPDGKLLATGDANGRINLWQVTDGRQILVCKGHTHPVRAVTFNPQGNMFASGSEDQTVKLWNVNTGECFATMQGHSGQVWSVTFSPDGKILASGSDDQTVRQWNLNTSSCLRILRGHTNWVRSVAFSPDGEMLASSSHDRTVKLWDVNTGECLKTLQGHTRQVWSVAFSSDGQTLASSSSDETVKLWDVNTGECLKTLQGHTRQVWSVAFSPDGQTLASGSDDRIIKLWDVDTAQCRKTLQGYTNWVRSVAFSPNSLTLASVSNDPIVKLWDVNTSKCLKFLQGHTDWVWSVAFSPDGQTLASGSDDKTVRLWNVNTGECLKTLRGHTDWVWSVAFSPNGQALASGSDDGTIKLWDISTGQCLKTLREHTNWVRAVAFSPDSHTLASSSNKQIVRLWDITTGECLKTLQGHTNWVRSVAFNPNGQTLASGSEDSSIRLWDINTGECFKTLQGHTGWVLSVAFSPNGQILATASTDQMIRLWNVSEGQCCKILQGHTEWVQSVTFSADGHTLASSSEDETIRIWDVKTGNCLKTLRSEKPYDSMNITGVTGLTKATISTLKALGAVEL